MQSAWGSVATEEPEVDSVGAWPLFDAGGGVTTDGGTWIDLDTERYVNEPSCNGPW